MAELNKMEKKVLEKMLKEDGWEMVEKARNMVIDKWREEVVGGQDAYSELKNIHKQQGRIEGLEQFFEILEQQALQ